MEQKLLELEKRTEQLEKMERTVYSKTKELENEIDVLLKQDKQPFANVTKNKADHLTEVNEEMFRQNVRLRELIEYCIVKKEAPTQETYYRALLAANEEG